ncbi:MAG: isoprenylcysteine carboxyl methyltransferase [Hyphomicrobiales bacterium]|nr:MAG: isoprenylcysteine carboxyl methyltransferase [Hyphomicrobiales bacterium]
MKNVKTPPNRIPWPPILYLTSIISAYTIEQKWGAIWLDGHSLSAISTIGFHATGILLIGAGLVLDFYSAITLRKHLTTILPTKAASHLVTSGPFSISRNPIYLGNTIITFGLALFFENIWYILLGLVAAFITNEIVIKREERHLLEMFGEEWEKYTQKVRRWF